MNNTTCEDFRGLLDRLLDGEITPEEQARLDAHAAACPDCAALREALLADREALADALGDVPPMPEDTHEAWMAAIRAEKAGTRAAGRRKWLRWAGAAAAALYLVGKKRRYAHTAFHVFTVAGSLLHFLCILLYVI